MAKAAAKTKKAPAKKSAKKAPAKKVAKAPKAAAPQKANSESLAGLDRKSLAAKARQLKTELLAIRFNVQSPSLKEYRQKRRELASLLGHLN